MNIYTKKGDKGETSLFGGKRVLKCDPRIDSYGNIDELIANMGLIRSIKINPKHIANIEKIQNILMNISAIIADEQGKLTEKISLSSRDISFLEEEIDEMEKHIAPLNNFILPGGELSSAYCHVARTVCRRAERRIVELNQSVEIHNKIIPYLNRLSDYLFTLARLVYAENNTSEEIEFSINSSR